VVGWMVANRESAVLAKQLITQTCAKHAINRDELTLHADRGSSMKSKLVSSAAGRPRRDQIALSATHERR